MIYTYRVYICIVCASSSVSLYLVPAGIVLAPLNNAHARPQKPTPQEHYNDLVRQQKILTKQMAKATKKKEAWVQKIKGIQERVEKSRTALFKYQQINTARQTFILEAFEEHGFTHKKNPIQEQCYGVLEFANQEKYKSAKDCLKETYERIMELEQEGYPKKAILLWKQEHARVEQVWYAQLCKNIDQIIIDEKGYELILTTIRQEKFAAATKMIQELDEIINVQAKELSAQGTVLSQQLLTWAQELMRMHSDTIIDAYQRQCVFIMDLISNRQLSHAKERIKELAKNIEQLQKKELSQEEIAQCKKFHNEVEHAWYAAACTGVDGSGTCLKLCVTVLDQVRRSNNVKQNKRENELHKAIQDIAQLRAKIITLKQRFADEQKEYIKKIRAQEKIKENLTARIQEIDDSPDSHLKREEKDELIEALEGVKEILYAQKQDKQKLEASTTLCDQIYLQIQETYHLQAAHVYNITVPTAPEPIPEQDDALIVVGAGGKGYPDNIEVGEIETEIMCFNFNNSLLEELDVKNPKYEKLVTRPAELKKRLEEVEHDLALALAHMNNKPINNTPARRSAISPEQETIMRAAKALLKTDRKSALRSDVESESQGSTELRRASAGPLSGEQNLLLPKIEPKKRAIDLGPDPRTAARKLPPRQPSTSQVYTFRSGSSLPSLEKPAHVLMGLESGDHDF